MYHGPCVLLSGYYSWQNISVAMAMVVMGDMCSSYQGHMHYCHVNMFLTLGTHVQRGKRARALGRPCMTAQASGRQGFAKSKKSLRETSRYRWLLVSTDAEAARAGTDRQTHGTTTKPKLIA